MVFSSLTFLCVFLPLTLGAYYLCPRRGRNAVLLAASLAFYAWGEPKYVLLMVLSITANYLFGRLIAAGRKKLWLTVSLVFDLGLLCVFKYTCLLLDTFHALTGAQIDLPRLALPIGISFYTFQAMSYTIDVYRGTVAVQKNLADFGAYISMFPQLIAGPIVRYADVERELRERRVDAEAFAGGLCRFSVGLAKKVLLANQFGALWETASAGAPSAMMAWLGALAFTFQIYFDFSGYSDMAIGLGALFGFHFPENFRHPYESTSVTEFWRRWHISLGTWFREYLYIPLGGNRRGTARQLLNLLIVWSLTGLWHGAGWNFLLWGVYYFILLALEKLFLLKHLEKLPAFVRHLYTLLAVVLGWVLFACDGAALGVYVRALAGANGARGGMDVYYLLKYAPLLLIAAVGSTSLPQRLAAKVKPFWPRALGALVLLALSAVLLIGESYNPFLYFRF